MSLILRSWDNALVLLQLFELFIETFVTHSFTTSVAENARELCEPIIYKVISKKILVLISQAISLNYSAKNMGAGASILLYPY